MIHACNSADVLGETGASGESPVSRHSESETFSTDVRHSSAQATPTDPQSGSTPPSPAASGAQLSASERHECEVIEKLRRKVRAERDMLRSNPQKTASRHSESETFSTAVRHSTPPVEPAPASASSATTEPAPTAEMPTVELTPHLLRQKQSLALHALLQGQSVVDAAKAAGVNRRTVHRWQNQPEFQAELQQVQSSFCRALRKNAAEMCSEAVEVIQEAIERGSLSTALELLKAVNILNGRPLTAIDGLNDAAQPDPAVAYSTPPPSTTAPPAAATNAAATNAAETLPSEEPAAFAPAPFATELPTLDDLIPPQQIALTALLECKLPYQAADLAGVPLSKLHRWMKHDTAFRQVLLIGRQAQERQLRTQLLNLSMGSLEILGVALKKFRKVRVAFAILRGVGLLSQK